MATAAVIGALLAVAGTAGTAQAAVGDVTVFTAGYTGGTYFGGITTGPDGNLWFTKQTGPVPQNQIGRVTPTGTYTFFGNTTTIQSGANLEGITVGSDGNLWFAELDTGDIGRITPTGTITEFDTATCTTCMEGIVSGPDGNLWISENVRNAIGMLPTSGSPLTEFTSGITAGRPQFIALGPDGNLWFNEFNGPKIAKITTAGTITEYSSGTRAAHNVTGGPDGRVWFTEYGGPGDGRIGRINTDGSGLVEFNSGLSSNPGLGGITLGADGNLWFAEQNANKVGRITPTGTITEFDTGLLSSPTAITAGPDGNVWFMTSAGVARIITGAAAPGNPTLTVTRSGNGSGTVTGDQISCPATCSATYAPGTQVTLTATPDAGSSFAGWAGACSGTGACTATVNGPTAVVADFASSKFEAGALTGKRKVKVFNGRVTLEWVSVENLPVQVSIKFTGEVTERDAKRAKKKTIKVGKAKFEAAPNKTTRFKVKVSKKALKYLKTHKSLKTTAKEKASANGETATGTDKLTIKAP